MTKKLFASTLALALLLCAGASWAGIGVYEVSITGTCPYPITYLLNKNATSVTIEVFNSTTLAVVKTWSFAPPDTHCNKGIHTDIAWDPANDLPVPAAGNYKAKITATGAAVTGPIIPPAVDPDNKLMPPVWEAVNADGTAQGWRAYGIAVNKDPASGLYGRVYVCNYSISGGKAKNVYEFYGDGTLKGTFPAPSAAWGGSAPWGIEFDDDNHLFIGDRSGGRYFRWAWNGTAWVETAAPQLTGQDRGLTVTGSGATFRIAQPYWAQGTASVPPSNTSRIYFGTGETDTGIPGLKNCANCPPYPGSATINDDDTFIGMKFVGTDLYIAGAVGNAARGTPETGDISVWDTTQPFPWTATSIRYGQYSRVTGIDILNGATWMGRIIGLNIVGEYNYADVRDVDVAHRTIYKLPLGDIATLDPYANPAPAGFVAYGVGTAYTGTYKNPFFVKADPVGNLVLTGGNGTIIGTGMFFGVYEEPLNVATSHNTTSRMSVYWPGEYVPVYISGIPVPASVPADGATPTRITVVAEDRNNTPTLDDIQTVKVYCPSVGWGAAGDTNSGWPMTRRSRTPDGLQNTYWNDATVARYSGAGWHPVKVYVYDVHVPGGVPIQEGEFQLYVTAGKIAGTITEGKTGYAAANITVKQSFADAYGTWTTEAVTDASGNYLIDATESAADSVFPAQAAEEVYSLKTYPGTTYPAEFNVANAHASTNWPTSLGATDWPITAPAVALGGTTSGVNGRVWPLVASQVTYKWAAGTYRAGGRTVCAQGYVTRQAVDAPRSQQGFNGYYAMNDEQTLSVNMGVKVNTRPGDPEIVNNNQVVVIGTYDKLAGYSAGVITPTMTPVVTGSGTVTARLMDRLSYFNGNLLYTYYKALDCEVMSADVPNQHFSVKLSFDGATVLCDVDTIATTGITIPAVGDRVDLFCILDQHEPGVRALRPGLGSDVHVIPIAADLGIIKKATDGTAIFNNSTTPLVVTYVDPITTGDFPEDLGKWIWVESQDRSAGLKVYTGAAHAFLPAGLAVGSTISIMKGQLNSTGTQVNTFMDRPRELQLSEMPTADNTPVTVPAFLDLTVKSFGGGWASNLASPSKGGDGTPAVINAIGPPVQLATGLNTEGLLTRVAGKIVGYGEPVTPDPLVGKVRWFYIDDGTGTVSDNGMTGIKVVQLNNLDPFVPWPQSASDIGRPAAVAGICSNRFISGVGRIRMLLMRVIPGTGGYPLDMLDWLDD